jgi:hypothetical protein
MVRSTTRSSFTLEESLEDEAYDDYKAGILGGSRIRERRQDYIRRLDEANEELACQ